MDHENIPPTALFFSCKFFTRTIKALIMICDPDVLMARKLEPQSTDRVIRTVSTTRWFDIAN